MLALTERALTEARALSESNQTYRGLPLRVYIEGKGCDGFYYGVTFDEKLPSDHVFKFEDLELVVDQDSFQFICNSTIDFVDDERGRGFLVQNPDHRKYRGKFYKKQIWKEALAKKKDGTTSSFQS